MKMKEKCHINNSSDNPLISRRSEGGKNGMFGLLQAATI